ncbi:MAG: hypothetical protein L0I76_03030 [Pseudonocardia sp.]|nr:hypothetical protein [Pseudonocardia sp.]
MKLYADEFPSSAPRFSPVSVSAAVLDEAARIAAVHRLRAHDAVQLACARAAADPDRTQFAAFDAELRAAATAERFDLMPAGSCVIAAK